MAESDNSLIKIDLGDWSKPANTLIEKCAEAVGGIFRPSQIRRVAQAEADAREIRAVAQINAQIKVTKLQRRALTRFVAEETKKQVNIETILRKALPEVNADAKPEKMGADWITNFFDKCRLISDEQMQILWAKVLAGEANAPGSFSKRTVVLLGAMDKTDATLFSALCRFMFTINEDRLPIVFDTVSPIYVENGVSFGTLLHLADAGLIQFDPVGQYNLKLNGKVRLCYFEQQFEIAPPKFPLIVGQLLQTRAGQQLSPFCQVKPVEGFADYATEHWKQYGVQLERVP
jgi:hypothetical protein